MNEPNIEQAFNSLFDWCRHHDFAGYDPFDALNSRVFQATPLRHSRTARLVWTQICKRSPLNLRSLALIPAQKNSKGLALFALAALANYRRRKTAAAETEAKELMNQLLALRIEGYSGAAWGYNFPWQSRNFFAPPGTPTIVPTAFAVRALIEGYEIFKVENYLEAARSACDFIINDLKRTVESEKEVCFSYSPRDETRIFNASLLAAETLASVGAVTGETELTQLARRAARYVVKQQRDDGSWPYGAEAKQSWTDSFHTAYVLLSLARIRRFAKLTDAGSDSALRQGYRFWREGFLLADGWPKYYHDTLYPADAHAAATAIVTLVELKDLDASSLAMAEKLASWTISKLRDQRGFFYYQRRHFYTVRTPFMRWTQAWMLYAFARLLEEQAP
jgi:hypothetical protein